MHFCVHETSENTLRLSTCCTYLQLHRLRRAQPAAAPGNTPATPLARRVGAADIALWAFLYYIGSLWI